MAVASFESAFNVFVKNGKVYPGGIEDPDPITGADLASFEVAVKEEDAEPTFWGRDKNRIYFSDVVLQGVDRRTFVVIDGQIAKDKNRVWCWDFGLGKEFSGAVNALSDPLTFERLTSPGDKPNSQFWYFRDKNHVFSKWCTLVEEADHSTFHMVSEPTVATDAIDKAHRYSLGRVVDNHIKR